MPVVTAVLPAVLVLLAATLLAGPPSTRRLRRVVPGPERSRARPSGRTVRLRRLFAARRDGPQVRIVAEQWAAGLRSGLGAAAALDGALSGDERASPHFARTRTALAAHGDVPGALRADADGMSAADRRAVRSLAACWEVGGSSGGGLAAAVERIADSVRADALHRDHVRSELAGPHASARLLAVLPLLVLLLSSGLGLATPHEVLTTPAALLVLAAGLLLDGAGLWWTRHLARSAERTA